MTNTTARALQATPVCFLLAFPAFAAGIDEKALLTPYPGSTFVEDSTKEFDDYELVVGGVDSIKAACGNKQALSGRVVRLHHENPKERSEAEIFANYASAAKKAGFQTSFTCKEESCFQDGKPSNNVANCGDRSIGWFPQAGSRYLAAKLSRKDGDVYLAIHVQRHRTDLHYVTVKPMETDLVKVDARALKAGIVADGHVAVYGIYFDVGAAELKPTSAPAIAEIVKLLKQDPALRIHVVGHTDSTGDLASNLTLSRRRAEAVVKELITGQGIAAARLRPDGVGPLCPVSTNGTDTGRAKNRRVDLVRQ